ncbi:MAG: hypothetical protein COB12_13330 [Flavobacterium sp.]|nr:MAG: hypothetical protein COB12_13330 [Flavobacterium sp.]
MKILIIILLFIPLISCGQTDSITSIIKSRINHETENPVHSVLIYIEKENKKFIYHKGFGKLDKDLQSASNNDQFRIASITKLFVSTIILQLNEEGKLNLNDKASKYLENIDYLDFENLHLFNQKKFAFDITIEQLLSHRTGLADIFTDKEQDFFDLLLQNQKKQYSPKSIIELYYLYNLNQTPHFEPNKGWYYSDMNFVLIGLIIEQIERVKLSESIRNRILNPLKMQDTYFEFYESPIQKNNMINQYVGNLNFTEINTSFDWSGGGIVSTNVDLATFIKSLFDLKLTNRTSLNKIIDVKFSKENENRYGLGIYESKYNGNTYFGHYGFYGTYVGYCPDTKTVISYSISQATPDFSVYNFINEILKLAE